MPAMLIFGTWNKHGLGFPGCFRRPYLRLPFCLHAVLVLPQLTRLFPNAPSRRSAIGEWVDGQDGQDYSVLVCGPEITSGGAEPAKDAHLTTTAYSLEGFLTRSFWSPSRPHGPCLDL